jgi:hypothetical protein
MKHDNEAMKRLMDGVLLRKTPPDTVRAVFRQVIEACQSHDIRFDAPAALEYWWSLARIGIVAVPGDFMQEGVVVRNGPQPIRLHVTERGRKLLERGEDSPHDPPKYMAAVRRRVESPDAIALAYLDEAVGAWFAGLHRASTVMLGCACERLVLLLAGAIATADLPPWSGRLAKKLGCAVVGVSDLFETVRGCLSQMSGEKKLPAGLGDAIDRKLSPIFEHARGLRNQSGHPTGADVSADDAEAGLLLFPGFCALVNDLCKVLTAARPGNGVNV